MVDGGLVCVKYVVFAFNFVFFLAGCGILGVGVWLRIEKDDYAQFTEYDFVTASNLAIAAGALIVIVCFLGCCGAIKENKLMLLIFFVLLLLIFILEVTAGGLGYAYRDKVEDKIREDWNKTIHVRYEDSEGLRSAVDKFQKEFKCCGNYNIYDWRYSSYYINGDPKLIPTSCCKEALRSSDDCTKSPQVFTAMNQKGCYEEVKEYFKDNLLIVGAVAIGIAVVQILGMIFAMVLYCGIRKEGSFV